MLSSIFVGVPQSRYAAIAILAAMFVISALILFGKEPIPLSQKFGFILLVLLISLPSLLLALFQLTCLVTGAGFKNQRWWCSSYAWIISIMMIVYAVLLIGGALMNTNTKDVAPFTDLGKDTAAKDPKELIASANKKAEKFFAEGDEEEDNEGLPNAGMENMVGKINGGASLHAPFPGENMLAGNAPAAPQQMPPTGTEAFDATQNKYASVHEGFVGAAPAQDAKVATKTTATKTAGKEPAASVSKSALCSASNHAAYVNELNKLNNKYPGCK